MKKHLLFLMLICFCFASKADHILGYDMQLINIKNSNGIPTDNYKWRLRVYRPITGISLPLSFTFNVYLNVTNTVVGNFTVSKVNPQSLLKFPESDCYPKTANNQVEVGIYESPSISYALLNNSNKYYISASLCCRASGITNIPGNSSSYGSTFTMDFPSLGSTSIGRYNTTPEFKWYPSYHLKIGRTYVLDWSANDVDGDSLVYSFVNPLDDNTTKPFSTISYIGNFKLDSNIADGNPDLTINALTGQALYKPTKLGFYAINIKVDEYRKNFGVAEKISTTYREFAFKVINEINNAPILTDHKIRSQIIRDTINFFDEYTLSLWGKDIAGDSLYMSVIPNLAPGENIFDPNVFGAKFGYFGAVQSGSAAQNLVLKGDSLLVGQFKWKPFCKNSRTEPYKVSFVLRDRNCADAKDDTLHVFLYVKKKPNSPPMFISPDTIINNKVLKYYVKQNTWFQLDGDSIIKTYDQDSTQVVNMFMIINPNNPKLSNISFIPNPSPVNSFATFKAMYTCTSDTPYKYTIVAYDDDCIKKDTVYLNIEIYVLPEVVLKETICGVMVDSLSSFPGNIIYWDNVNTASDVSYLLYKKNRITNEYDYVGNTSTNAIGDYNVNSSAQNETYKVVATNTCGTRADSSEGMQSLLLNASHLGTQGIQLNWDGYSGMPNDSFYVLRRYNKASYVKIATLSNSIRTYVDSNSLIGVPTTYIVQLERKANCIVSSGTSLRIFSMISNQFKLFFNNVNSVKQFSFSIHPSPTSSIINIVGLPENELNDLYIFDVLGKQVYTQKAQGTVEVDLSSLSKGVYFVRVGATTRKVIKN